MSARPRRLRAPLAAAALAVTLPAGAHAQWVGSIGDDALVLPRGMLRVGVGGAVSDHAERYEADGGGRVPLGAPLSFGASPVPAVAGMATVQQLLRGLTGDAALVPSLGPLTIRAEARRSVLPVRFDVGIGARLQLTATVPYVETRVSTSVASPGTEVGDLGLNPALTSPEAAAINAELETQLRTGAESLRGQLAGCGSGGGGPACADPSRATAVASAADATANLLRALYGVNGETGQPVVPVAGSAAAAAVAGRLESMRAELAGFGVDGVPTGATPASAAVPMTPAALASALTDGAFGFGLSAFGQANRYGIGDVEIGARFRLLDPWAGDPAAGAVEGVAVRASVGALVRLGTGTPDRATHLADIGAGDGQTDVEVSAAADLLVGRRLSVSVSGRYGVQLAHDVERLVPAAEGEVYQAAVPAVVRRDLGDYLELEVTPRWALSEFVAVGAHYRLRTKGEDRYEWPTSGAVPDTPPLPGSGFGDPTLLGAGTEGRQQVAGVGVVMSTLSAYAAGRIRAPLEVSYRHSRTVAGRGRLTPHERVDEVGVRLYLGVFGGR